MRVIIIPACSSSFSTSWFKCCSLWVRINVFFFFVWTDLNGKQRTCFNYFSNNHLKTLERLLNFRLEKLAWRRIFFFNNRNYMKSNPLRAVSQAFADTNELGNEHKLASTWIFCFVIQLPSTPNHRGSEEMRQVPVRYTRYIWVPLWHSISFG